MLWKALLFKEQSSYNLQQTRMYVTFFWLKSNCVSERCSASSKIWASPAKENLFQCVLRSNWFNVALKATFPTAPFESHLLCLTVILAQEKLWVKYWIHWLGFVTLKNADWTFESLKSHYSSEWPRQWENRICCILLCELPCLSEDCGLAFKQNGW